METLSYFKKLEKDTGIFYHNLMKLYLKDCAESERRPIVAWTSEARIRIHGFYGVLYAMLGATEKHNLIHIF
jgi:hypothetical protein